MTLNEAIVDKSIRVGHLARYEEARWRDAILFYLFGLWSGKLFPVIHFGNLTLRVNRAENDNYFAYGTGTDEILPMFSVANCLTIDEPTRAEVEVGLIRFVKDNRIRKLTLRMGPTSWVVLFKKARRCEYGVYIQGVPAMWE